MSADALDEGQYASERNLAMRNLDREPNLLRNVRSARRRIEECFTTPSSTLLNSPSDTAQKGDWYSTRPSAG